jgi:hypothetical protein
MHQTAAVSAEVEEPDIGRVESPETLRPDVGSLDALIFEGDSPQNPPPSTEIEVPLSVN